MVEAKTAELKEAIPTDDVAKVGFGLVQWYAGLIGCEGLSCGSIACQHGGAVRPPRGGLSPMLMLSIRKLGAQPPIAATSPAPTLNPPSPLRSRPPWRSCRRR